MLEQKLKQAHGTAAAARMVINDVTGAWDLDDLVHDAQPPGWAHAARSVCTRRRLVGSMSATGESVKTQGSPTAGRGDYWSTLVGLRGSLGEKPGDCLSSGKIASGRERRDGSYP